MGHILENCLINNVFCGKDCQLSPKSCPSLTDITDRIVVKQGFCYGPNVCVLPKLIC